VALDLGSGIMIAYSPALRGTTRNKRKPCVCRLCAGIHTQG